MSEDNAHVEVRKGAQADRFEITVDGQLAGFTECVDTDGLRIFPHTKIDEAYGGRGLGAILVGQALESTRSDGLKIVPVCPFVVKYLEKHPDQYTDIVQRPTREILQSLRRG